MNLPNRLTVTRIVLTILMIILLLFPWYEIGFDFPKFLLGGVLVNVKYLIAGGIFVIASITDFLDGYIARKKNLITNTGKMLDSIADKFLVNSALIILSCQGFIHPIIPVVIVLRDIVVNAIKMEASTKGKVVAAIKSGKIKTATLMIGIILTFVYNLPFELININVADFLLYFAMVMSIFSAYEYYQLNKKLLLKKEEAVL